MSGYLLDTHITLWWLEDTALLSPKAMEALRSKNATLWVSVAALWEMAIKRALKRLDYPHDIVELLAMDSVHILPITPEHALAVSELPLLHNDPFDRIQICQAKLNGLTIITRDDQMTAYGVPCVRG